MKKLRQADPDDLTFFVFTLTLALFIVTIIPGTMFLGGVGALIALAPFAVYVVALVVWLLAVVLLESWREL